ncbi:MAG: glycosyltransferase family 39 protein [Thaumarchaeota archaeon]|nr:glycosyltransferase family 39 protein [Nitrososphaerota archaeon]
MGGERSYSGLRFWVMFLAGLSFLDLAFLLVVIVLHAANPLNIEVVVMFPLLYIFAGALVSSLVLALFWFMLRYPTHRKTLMVVMLITTGVLVAHFYTINEPPTSSCFDSGKAVDGCVMDEIYYIPAAQALLTGEKCGPYADNCNYEHPFLSKAFIAAGIVLFGDNDFGWRFFVVLLGTASIPVLFAICWRVTRDSTLSLFATFLLAFETLFFAHSSIAVIDVQAIFFALLAFLVYLGNFRIWRLNRFALSGILLGLAALSKETAIFMVIFLVVYNLLYGDGGRRFRFLSSVQVFVVAALVFIAGLQLYATLFGNSSATTFLDEIRYILSYGASLKGQGWIDQVLHAPITPLNWMTYYSAVGYFVTRVTVNGTYSYVSLGYWGVPNFFEIWLTFLWAPYVVYLAYKKWRGTRVSVPATEGLPEVPAVSADLSMDDAPVIAASPPEPAEPVVEAPTSDPAFKLARFALLWFSITYFPYFVIYYFGRVTYPFYLLPAIPAIAIGCAYILTRRWFPREVAYVILGGVFLWFFLYYPDKSFLPTWIRMILGH